MAYNVFGCSASILVVSVLICSVARAEETPDIAREAGYLVNTFSSQADFSPSTVDQSLTFIPGMKWYNSNIIKGAQQSPDHNIINADGSITTSSLRNALGLVTAANIAKPPGFVGQAFGGGGYFEAELRFDPTTVDLKAVWPAFWSVSLESSAALPVQRWNGQQPNFNHTVELDIFEYLYALPKPRNIYGAAGHEFFGIYDVTCKPGRCKVDSVNNERVAPADTDWSQYHKFGMLWIPATEDSRGSVKFYFDRKQIGSSIQWTKFRDEDPPVTASSPWKFGILDRQHLILILTAGRSSPITVRSVNVWQASARANLRN
ncbi:hypothetical protein ABIB90_004572 [Bradyrhizobium sp. JR4.1]|uniref:hypothetical protein n=1 Tax=Bradyrhizobium sp. JR4.1 TaxID=3156372 RepID=UPI0033912BE4